MSSTSWQRLQVLFEAALALPEEQRPRYLEKACGTDLELKRRLEALLENDGDGTLAIQEAIGEAARQHAGTSKADKHLPWRFAMHQEVPGTFYCRGKNDAIAMHEAHNQSAVYIGDGHVLAPCDWAHEDYPNRGHWTYAYYAGRYEHPLVAANNTPSTDTVYGEYAHTPIGAGIQVDTARVIDELERTTKR